MNLHLNYAARARAAWIFRALPSALPFFGSQLSRLQIAVLETRDKIFTFIAGGGGARGALGNWSALLIFRTRTAISCPPLAPLDVFIGNIQSRIRMLAAALQFQWLLDQQNERESAAQSPLHQSRACGWLGCAWGFSNFGFARECHYFRASFGRHSQFMANVNYGTPHKLGELHSTPDNASDADAKFHHTDVGVPMHIDRLSERLAAGRDVQNV